MVPDLGMVDSQELVRSSGHVDEVGLALGPLAVKELVYRLVWRGLFEMGADNLK